ncbi:MAG: NUDIX domain-containing protein [Clostridiales bacterium]|nr:NUDIX domain-containing protein [Clostridiales bacterium]
MIILRNAVAAFLQNSGNFLLMKRAPEREIAPGLWSGVGGHMEPREINNPLAAVYREIEEETGITRAEIPLLELRYIITRRIGNEIRQTYIYFGETTQTEVIQTREGELHWIKRGDLLKREFSKTFTAMLEHYLATDKGEKGENAVYAGVAFGNNGKLQINWVRCDDFEK